MNNGVLTGRRVDLGALVRLADKFAPESLQSCSGNYLLLFHFQNILLFIHFKITTYFFQIKIISFSYLHLHHHTGSSFSTT